ncbi:MAG: polymer-forming cytoskeletal protein [Pseudomonadota bacterium]
MFRRREETENDDATLPNLPAHGNSQNAVDSANLIANNQNNAAQPATNNAGNNQNPQAGYSNAPAQPAQVSAVSRPAAAGSLGNYRPASPVMRPAAASQQTTQAQQNNNSHNMSTVTAAAAEKSAIAAASAKSNRRILTVGNDILLKGEIATCDRLVIEGRVEAKLSDVHTVEIAACGSFIGTAEVEDAEISGIFEGDLIVHNRLVIYTGGEVRGNITYGEIEIERGGKLSGQIKTVENATIASSGKKLLDILDVKTKPAKDMATA